MISRVIAYAYPDLAPAWRFELGTHPADLPLTPATEMLRYHDHLLDGRSA